LKFDPEGVYVKRWVPELADCPTTFIHEPWKLSKSELIRLDYPEPIVEHALARQRFLAVAKGHLGGETA
jgi:deoxyribodipyrimidine photo-lyase